MCVCVCVCVCVCFKKLDLASKKGCLKRLSKGGIFGCSDVRIAEEMKSFRISPPKFISGHMGSMFHLY